MKTIEQAIVAGENCLEAAGIENPRLESEHLVAALLHVSRTHLVLHRREPLTPKRVRELQRWLYERQQRKPLAYVTGEQPFREISLKVTSAALIPRPETELLVEQAFRILENRDTEAVAVDVGTGSGNIALCLSKHPCIRHVIGIDISPEALALAKENQGRLRPPLAVEWRQGHLLEPVQSHRGEVDLIVANLPYVRTREMDDLEPELHWEPPQALDGGVDGLRLIEPCIKQASTVLRRGGVLLLEIGADQHQDVLALLSNTSIWSEVSLFSDMAGLPRIIQARRQGH